MQKGIVQFFLALLLMGTVSCSTDSGITRVFYEPDDKPVQDTLKPVSQIASVEDGARLFVRDDILLALPKSSKDYELFVANLKTGDFRYPVRTGRGPGEMLALYDMAVDQSGNVYLLDIALRKIATCHIDSLVNDTYNIREAKTIDVTDNSLFSIAAGDNVLYGTGLVDETRFFELYFLGNQNPIAVYSPDPEKPLDKFINQAYMGKMTYNYKNSSVVLACLYSDQIEIFNPGTKKVIVIQSSSGPRPSYTIVSDHGGTLAHKDDEVECYYDVRTVGDYIIAQYDGRLIGDPKLRAYTEYRVFSVEGHYITRFCVEGHARSFDLSKDGQMMYVAMQDGIYSFDMSTILNNT